MSKPAIITEIKSLKEFERILIQNPGLIIIKFGATWCQPCKRIERQVYQSFDQMPSNVQCIIVDVDVSFELYHFLKNKKMIHGIPALLLYEQGNTHYVPNDIIVGADPTGINAFFARAYKSATSKA
jgi:thioredoxin 1